MRLAPGARLGRYDILAALGAGGMGEVYRARDSRLDRTVAVKVLNPELAADPGFRTRFDREARTLSSLTHPHICVVHDVGHDHDIDYLVLEYLEGQTLAERLTRDGVGLKLGEALRIAIEIADALDAAHRHGIVHRDLKPGNVMVTAGGAKLLDFGLAKQDGGAAAALASLATQPEAATARGVLVGTLPYMAPEQLQGGAADARTDIFALGGVIYEMVTGRRAFRGDTQASLIGKILETDPPAMSTIAAVSPPVLDRVVQRCLAKDPDDRWQNARDLLLELRWIREAGTPAAAAPGARQPGARKWLMPIAAAAVLVAGALGWLARPVPAALDRPMVQFDFEVPTEMSLEDWRGWPTLSPDGRTLVVPVALEGTGLLAVRRLDETALVPLAGTERATGPFFSPDGRSIAFTANGKLRRIDLAGGPAAALADGASTTTGGAWNADGVLLFAHDDSGLFRVQDSGGTSQPVTTLDVARGDIGHRFPQFLPDGRSFLFGVRGRAPGLYAGSLDTPETRLVMPGAVRGFYVDPGYLVFQRARAVLAVPFDPRRLESHGDPSTLAEQVFANQYSGSAGGDLVYRPDGTISSQLTWYRRDGTRLGAVAAPGPFRQLALSPSGRRVALQRGEAVERGTEADIWVVDLSTEVVSRLTTHEALDTDPAWAPDERRLAFTSSRMGRASVFVKDLSSGRETQLFEHPAATVVDEWTPDGRFLVFRVRGRSIHTFPMTSDGNPRVLLDAPGAIVDQSHVSVDGRWIAYNSDESGTWEVYVASFPDFSSRRQVSTKGGAQATWRRDGRELFYLSPRGQLMAVDFRVGGSGEPDPGPPRELFRLPLSPSVQLGEYAPSADGQRFLVLEPVGDQPRSIAFVLNWLAKPR